MGVLGAVVTDLDRLRALADAAIDGPWEVYTTAQAEPVVVKAGLGRGTGYPWGVVARPSHDPVDYGFANAAFIAAARTAVPDLIDRLTAAEEKAERLRRSNEDCVNGDLHARVEAAERRIALASAGDVALDAIVTRSGERVRELTAERDAAEKEAERLRERVDFLAPFPAANEGLCQALIEASADVARFRAALTDPAAVEAVAAAAHDAVCRCKSDHLDRYRTLAAAALRAFAAFVDEEADR